MYRVFQNIASGPDVHHDTLLSNIAVEAFDTGELGFVADQLFPAVRVAKQSNRYAIIDKQNFLLVPDALRAPKTEARRVEFDVSSDAYFADNYALAAEIALEDLANADEVFRLRENNIRLVVSQIKRAQEDRIAQIVTSISNVGSGVTLSGVDQWSDYVNSDPLGDITTAHAFIQAQTGLVANTVVIDYDTWKILRRHPDVLDLFTNVSGGLASDEQLRTALDVESILVAKSIKENALEDGVASLTNIWGKNLLLAFIKPAVGMNTMTLGLRFQWMPDGFGTPFVAGSRREAGPGTRNIEIIEAGHFQDERVIASDLGYLIASTVA